MLLRTFDGWKDTTWENYHYDEPEGEVNPHDEAIFVIKFCLFLSLSKKFQITADDIGHYGHQIRKVGDSKNDETKAE